MKTPHGKNPRKSSRKSKPKNPAAVAPECVVELAQKMQARAGILLTGIEQHIHATFPTIVQNEFGPLPLVAALVIQDPPDASGLIKVRVEAIFGWSQIGIAYATTNDHVPPAEEREQMPYRPAPKRCCHRDTNGDGNCPIHSSPGVERKPVLWNDVPGAKLPRRMEGGSPESHPTPRRQFKHPLAGKKGRPIVGGDKSAEKVDGGPPSPGREYFNQQVALEREWEEVHAAATAKINANPAEPFVIQGVRTRAKRIVLTKRSAKGGIKAAKVPKAKGKK